MKELIGKFWLTVLTKKRCKYVMFWVM